MRPLWSGMAHTPDELLVTLIDRRHGVVYEVLTTMTLGGSLCLVMRVAYRSTPTLDGHKPGERVAYITELTRLPAQIIIYAEGVVMRPETELMFAVSYGGFYYDKLAMPRP